MFLIFANTVFYGVAFFVAIFDCTPRRRIWDENTPGHCLNNKTLYIFSAAFNIVSDSIMLTVPIYLIWTLQMSIRRKIGVSAIFATGVLSASNPFPSR